MREGNPPHKDAGFLGAAYDPIFARVNIIPVPWDATSSYGARSHLAPEAIVKASHQMDVEDSLFDAPYRQGIAVEKIDLDMKNLNQKARLKAEIAMRALEQGSFDAAATAYVNQASLELNTLLYERSLHLLKQKKLVGVLGGDHASVFGYIKALAVVNDMPFGILHLDAHHDLRRTYEGFVYSHASIFYNVMEEIPAVSKLVQVGIRDYSHEEKRYQKRHYPEIETFYAAQIRNDRLEGKTYSALVDAIIAALPSRVYISFDIDVLDPAFCPNTGTPVPGGLQYDEAVYLIERLALSGKIIIGFDLCEVAIGEDEWDANVGARLLYKLCGALLHTNKKT